jgi:hypothetical protein
MPIFDEFMSLELVNSGRANGGSCRGFHSDSKSGDGKRLQNLAFCLQTVFWDIP